MTEISVVFVLMVFIAIVAIIAGFTITRSVGVAGVISNQTTSTFTDTELISANPSVLAAQPATLTTRTNGTSGTLTMTNSNHGITTGQRVDLYWTGGQCYGAVVGTVSGTSVPIASVSGGTALPSTSTAISVGIATVVSFAMTGNNLTYLNFATPQNGYFVINDGSSDNFAAYVLAGGVYTWGTGDVPVNPLAGDTPTRIYMSHSYQPAAVSGNQGMVATALTH